MCPETKFRRPINHVKQQRDLWIRAPVTQQDHSLSSTVTYCLRVKPEATTGDNLLTDHEP